MPLPLAPILAGLGGVLINVAASMAGRVLISLGIAAITYTGFSVSIDWLKSQMLASLNGLPVQVIGILSMMKVGVCISMLFSALLARLVRQGLSGSGGGSLKRWVTK